MALIVDIEKKMGDFHLKVAFEAGDETLALLGASGCGKSMTLRCIAGIEKPDRGRIVLDNRVLFDSEKKINLTPQERRVGLMFQNYALFPNMTVMQNIAAGAKREKDRRKREESIHRVLKSFGLTGLADHYPRQLSGGQQQRVALARMLVSDPEILLLDEPFSALDSHLRFQLEQEVRAVIRSFGKSVVLVSHDRDEVYRMADSIVVMDKGKVESFGDKHRVFASPQTRMGALLTGCKNISAIRKLSEHEIYAVDWGMRLRVHEKIDGADFVGIRMHHICHGSRMDGENAFVCLVVDEIENPFSYTIMLRPASCTDSVPISWELDKPSWESLRSKEICICLPPENLSLLGDGACGPSA